MSARDTLERFECREQCAERGEPQCFEIDRQAAERGIAGPPEFGPCELCARLTTARLSALAAAGYKILPDTTHEQRSWMGDVDHENGLYQCKCIRCLRSFTGHKRRVLCRSCAASPPTDPEKQT